VQKYVLSELDSGERVISERVSSVRSVALGFWIGAGSRDERVDRAGVSHFIEHLLFKGTKRRSAAQIAEEIDAVGGVLNAFTGKEYTCYYAKVLGEDVKMTTELLADIFLESVFAPEEIDRERQVVLQEISQAEDTPDDFIHDLFNLHFWQGHPLSLPIFGSIDTVNAIDRELMVSFMADRYRAERILIAAAGAVDHDRLVADCERLFGSIPRNGKRAEIEAPRERLMVINHPKKLEQAHLCIGGPGLSQVAPMRYAAYLLNTALGGGMSSRLFQEVREKRGRVYSIYSFLSAFLDCGYFGIYAGTSPDWVDEVIEVSLNEIAKVARDGLKNEELARAKSQLKGNMLLGMESTDSRMNRLARNEIYFRRDIPLDEIAREIEGVGNEQVIELASSCFKPDRMGLVMLGDLKGRELDPGVFQALG